MRYAIIVKEENPCENDPLVYLFEDGTTYEQAVSKCKEMFFEDLEKNKADGAEFIDIHTYWDDDYNYGEMCYTDFSRNTYSVVDVKEFKDNREAEEMTGLERLNGIKWSIEDLDGALIAAGKEPTESNREKLEQMINDGFIGTIIEEINERLEILAENT